jgi:spermidine synthase
MTAGLGHVVWHWLCQCVPVCHWLRQCMPLCYWLCQCKPQRATTLAKPVPRACRIAVCAATLAALLPSEPLCARMPRTAGALEYETHSPYSHIRVRRQGNIRSLIFVRDTGEEMCETAINLKKPHELQLSYSRSMFTSYLFRPQQQRVLIIGLGGGAMVQFLLHYDPQLTVDAVEIDPAVVAVAARYFNTRSGGKVTIATADGFDYLRRSHEQYTVIYMDAFLRPSDDTDAVGTPARLKTEQFYKDLQKRLDVEGLVVFNLNPHPRLQADLRAIRAAFPQVYVFRTGESNLVAVATMAARRLDGPTLLSRGRELDRRFKTSFSFAELTRNLQTAK